MPIPTTIKRSVVVHQGEVAGEIELARESLELLLYVKADMIRNVSLLHRPYCSVCSLKALAHFSVSSVQG